MFYYYHFPFIIHCQAKWHILLIFILSMFYSWRHPSGYFLCSCPNWNLLLSRPAAQLGSCNSPLVSSWALPLLCWIPAFLNLMSTSSIMMELPWWLSGKEVPMQKMQVQSLGWEDPLEKEMATHSSILA